MAAIADTSGRGHASAEEIALVAEMELADVQRALGNLEVLKFVGVSYRLTMSEPRS